MERLEANGRHDEHVHGRDVCRVVTEKSFPGLRPPSPTLGHVLGDGRLRDLEAELEQFAVDARRSPKQVLPVHPPQPLPSEGRGREFESRRVRQIVCVFSLFYCLFWRRFAVAPIWAPIRPASGPRVNVPLMTTLQLYRPLRVASDRLQQLLNMRC